MTMLNNELVLENIREELLDELTDTGNLPMYSDREIQDIVYQRFAEG